MRSFISIFLTIFLLVAGSNGSLGALCDTLPDWDDPDGKSYE